MGLAHSPRIATQNLLLNLDFANIKNYNGAENLLQRSADITVSPWATFGANTSRTSNSIVAPDGSLTADTLATSSWVSGDSVYQDISIANGATPYTLSVFVKAGTSRFISFDAFYTGSSTQGFSFNFDLLTGGITGTGFAIAYPDGWYRIYFTANGTIAANNTLRFQVYLNGETGSVYLWGAQVEKGSYLNAYTPTTSAALPRANSIVSAVSSYTLTRTNPTSNYSQYNNGIMNFTRAATANSTNKNAAGDSFWTTITQTNLKPSILLYNDFTWEVWFKINDIYSAGYDGTEFNSAICLYRGWNQGFAYDSSNFLFIVVSNGGTVDYVTTPLGVSSGNVRQGNWHQAAVTRSGTLYTMYINGVSVTTKTINALQIADGSYTTNELHIGASKANGAPSTDGYFWFAKMDFACTNMYNRALSSTEIRQNFNALRGRFGI